MSNTDNIHVTSYINATSTCISPGTNNTNRLAYKSVDEWSHEMIFPLSS